MTDYPVYPIKKTNRGKKVSPAEVEKMRELAREGLAKEEIADEMGRTPQLVEKYCRGSLPETHTETHVLRWDPALADPKNRKGLKSEVSRVMRQYTYEAAAILIDIARNGENDSDRTKAAQTIIERGWGKAPSGDEVSQQGREITSFEDLSHEELEALAHAAEERGVIKDVTPDKDD